MSRSNAHPSAVFFLCCILCSAPGASARADWPGNGALLTSSTSNFDVSIAPDAHGGVFAFWFEARPDSPGVYASRLQIDGSPAPGWPTPGRRVVETDRFAGASTRAVPDGSGGAYVAYWNPFLSAPNPHLAVARLAADGSPAPGWPTGGLLLFDEAQKPVFARMIPDGSGGACLAWLVWRARSPQSFFSSVNDVRAVRVAPDGSVAAGWPATGLAVWVPPDSAPASMLHALEVAPDGAGGMYVAWQDSADGIGDAYVQHLTGAGEVAPGWPADGRPVSSVASRKSGPLLASDGTGGVLAGWSEYRAGQYDAFLTRFTSGGAVHPGWSGSGLSLGTGVSYPYLATLAADDAEGAIVVLGSYALDGTVSMIARHATGSGMLDASWPGAGVLLGTAPLGGYAWSVPDRGGGAYVMWESFPPTPPGSPRTELWASRVTGQGNVAAGWPAGGLAVSILEGTIHYEQLVADGRGAALAGWRREPLQSNAEMRGTRLTPDANPTTDVPPPPAAAGLGRAWPNPSAGELRLELALDRAAPVEISILDLAGRRVRTLSPGWLAAGRRTVVWDGRDGRGARVPAGIYFVQARWPGFEGTRRVVRID